MLSFQEIRRSKLIHRVIDRLRWAKYCFNRERSLPVTTPFVNFEVTNICNSRCVFCPYPIMQRKKEPMSMELFKRTVDEMAGSGVRDVNFCVTMGDPLLDPHLFERAKYVKEKLNPTELGFVTTLQWLHRWDLDEFLKHFNWLVISTSLSGPDSYKKFFGVDLYPKMLTNLENLLKRNIELGKPLRAFISLKPVNDSFETIIHHPDFKKIAPLAAYDMVSLALDSTKQGVDDWGESVKLPDYLKARLGKVQPREFTPCRFLYTTLMVYSNGKVGPCNCRDYEANSEIVLGNLAEGGLMKIWQGEKLRLIRENWRKKNEMPTICKTCRNYRYSFGKSKESL